MARFSRVLTLVLSTALLFGRQTPPGSSPAGGTEAVGPVIRVNVNLRQVDVVVSDAKGQPVTNLRSDDFLILEDGKPQQLTNFSWIEVAPPPTGAVLKALQERPSLWERFTGVPKFAKTPGNDILAAPVANPHKEDIRRAIAFVFQDAFNVPVIQRVRKFIDEQVVPGDMISVRSNQRSLVPGPRGTIAIRDSMGIFQQFTNDKRQLDAATERLPRTCDYLHLCVPNTIGALTDAIQSLSSLPGRKAVVFVGQYLGPVESIADMANRAGVVIYVLNTASGSPDGPSMRPGIELAKRTGGRRVLTDPGFDLTSDLNAVMEDLRGYYLLGYHTALTGAEFNRPVPARRKPAHSIEVKVLRAGFSTHFRDGFFGAPDLAVKPAPPPAGREEALADAMFSVFTADGVRVHLDPMFFASDPDPKTGKRSPVVHSLLDIDGRDMTYTDLDNGGRRTVLDVALAVFNADGTQAGAKNQAFTITIPREQVAQYPKISLQHAVDIPVSKPGPYQVRAAVRDAASRKVGSSYAFLDIPDFNRREIALSSLILSLPAGAAVIPAVRPEWNEFAPGTPVQFRCEVFGLKTPGKPPAPPRAEVGIRLYRGGEPVVDIALSPANIEDKDGLRFLAGQVRIPNDLPAGNYEMEIIVYDRLEAPKKAAAMQWTDLTIVRPDSPE